MRKHSTRVTALALAALLALPPAASASQALGTEIHYGTTQLAQGVTHTRQYLWSATYSDLRTENYVEYTPSTLVQPTVSYGNTVLSKSSLSSLAAGLEAEGKRVISGINGDYFVVSTGAPLGLVITDGILRSSSASHYALGFDSNGNAFIGNPELAITATFGGATYAVSDGLNKVRSETGGFILYTSDYNSTTLHSDPGIDVILTPSKRNLGQPVRVDLRVDDSSQDGSLIYNPITGWFEMSTAPSDIIAGQISDTLVYSDVPIIGGRMACTVEQVLSSEKSIDIPEGSLVLSINSKGNAELIQALSSLQPGAEVNIDITSPDERWESAVSAVGALYKMVTGGVVESGLDSAQAPRSAVGIRPDGSVIFYTVDGRQSGYSVGASMTQVAERLVELGCTEAVCMDGGGSTTLGATLPGEEQFRVLNQPSDGSLRSVSNALFLVADQRQTGSAERLAISPSDALVLSGSQLELSAVGVDNLGQATKRFSPDQINYSIDEDAGYISNGIFTAGTKSGTYSLNAQSGFLSGSSLITVVSNPSRITLSNEETGAKLTSVHLEPSETLELSADALYYNIPLVCQDEDFSWTITGNAGFLDSDGTLTAAPVNSTGTITVTANGTSVDIPLIVSGHIHTVESFEGDFLHMTGGTNAQIEPETRSAYIRYGKQSAKISYLTGEDGTASVDTSMVLREGEKYLTIWVYGDGSGNTLVAPIQTSTGITDEIVAVLNFTGWQQLTMPLPSGAQKVLSLKIVSSEPNRQGTIWLDQVTSANQFFPDSSAPEISMELVTASSEEAGDVTSLRALLNDNMGQEFTNEQISVTYDGWNLAFVWDGSTLTAQLPTTDGLAHRVTVTVVDTSGNIGRASLDIAAGETWINPFSDTDDHWAASYAGYLYDQGISTGVISGQSVLFQPDKNITRGEFALMISRWMRLDLTAYRNVQLPFADVANIPDWCLDSVKAMYALGIMQGSSPDGIITYANAGTSISRAEALTMLGRIQEKGYEQAELTFSDTSKIPDWSLEYIKTMVAQGIINGRPDGTINPTLPITRCEIAKILHAMR